MVEVHDHLAALRNLKQPLCTVVAAGGGIKDMLPVEPHEHERFNATREGKRRDASKNGALDDTCRDNLRLIDVTNHLDGERVRDPRVAIGVLEVHRRIVDGLGHVPKVDVQHIALSPP